MADETAAAVTAGVTAVASTISILAKQTALASFGGATVVSIAYLARRSRRAQVRTMKYKLSKWSKASRSDFARATLGESKRPKRLQVQVDREAELAVLRHHVLDSKPTIAFLTGPEGSGKSWVASQALNSIDHVLRVDLHKEQVSAGSVGATELLEHLVRKSGYFYPTNVLVDLGLVQQPQREPKGLINRKEVELALYYLETALEELVEETGKYPCIFIDEVHSLKESALKSNDFTRLLQWAMHVTDNGLCNFVFVGRDTSLHILDQEHQSLRQRRIHFPIDYPVVTPDMVKIALRDAELAPDQRSQDGAATADDAGDAAQDAVEKGAPEQEATKRAKSDTQGAEQGAEQDDSPQRASASAPQDEAGKATEQKESPKTAQSGTEGPRTKDRKKNAEQNGPQGKTTKEEHEGPAVDGSVEAKLLCSTFGGQLRDMEKAIDFADNGVSIKATVSRMVTETTHFIQAFTLEPILAEIAELRDKQALAEAYKRYLRCWKMMQLFSEGGEGSVTIVQDRLLYEVFDESGHEIDEYVEKGILRYCWPPLGSNKTHEITLTPLSPRFQCAFSQLVNKPGLQKVALDIKRELAKLDLQTEQDRFSSRVDAMLSVQKVLGEGSPESRLLKEEMAVLWSKLRANWADYDSLLEEKSS